MRIIDKNTDFYDYYQNVYPDGSITFDRTDSFLLTKEIMCEHLRVSRARSKYFEDELLNLVLLQICNTFWLFLVEVTKVNYDYYRPRPLDYSVELITTWKNYNKSRSLIKLDVVRFGWPVYSVYSDDKHFGIYDKSKLRAKPKALMQAIDTNDFEVYSSINKHVIIRGDNTRVEKHIPLLKACGIANCVDPLEVFLSFEEYFSLEKSSAERTASVGLTDLEKVGNHGFDTKTSFRGK